MTGRGGVVAVIVFFRSREKCIQWIRSDKGVAELS